MLDFIYSVVSSFGQINIKDAGMLEGVRRRSTKMIASLRNLSYEERLGMFSLGHRRLRGDMIEVFKIDSWYLKGKSREAFLYR